MKRCKVTLSIVATFAITACSFGMQSRVRVATYNIRRGGTEVLDKNKWENRKDEVFNLVHRLHPDIIGFQEVVKGQFNDLSAQLPEYNSFGEPRGANVPYLSWHKFVMLFAQNEYNPIFYNKDRIKLVGAQQGTFGLNTGWRPGLLPRVCTWGLFEDIQSGQKFYVYNTHLDHKLAVIRGYQIDMILKHIQEHAQEYPVILMGDFNANFIIKGPDGYNAEKLTTAGFNHALAIAQQVTGPRETRTGWDNDKLKIVDHIFVKDQNPTVLKYEVVTSPEGVFPSDHRPVLVDLALSK